MTSLRDVGGRTLGRHENCAQKARVRDGDGEVAGLKCESRDGMMTIADECIRSIAEQIWV